MVTRERECPKHGYFEVYCSITAPTVHNCPECGALGQTIYTTCRGFLLPRDVHFDGASDEVEYEEAQRDAWSTWSDRLHVDNAGTKDIPYDKLVKS